MSQAMDRRQFAELLGLAPFAGLGVLKGNVDEVGKPADDARALPSVQLRHESTVELAGGGTQTMMVCDIKDVPGKVMPTFSGEQVVVVRRLPKMHGEVIEYHLGYTPEVINYEGKPLKGQFIRYDITEVGPEESEVTISWSVDGRDFPPVTRRIRRASKPEASSTEERRSLQTLLTELLADGHETFIQRYGTFTVLPEHPGGL